MFFDLFSNYVKFLIRKDQMLYASEKVKSWAVPQIRLSNRFADLLRSIFPLISHHLPKILGARLPRSSFFGFSKL